MTENVHTFQINPKSTRKEHGNMVALKRIEDYCYFLTDEIGLGFTSHVYKGRCESTSKPVAVKVIDRKSNEDELQKQFLQEQVAVLERIKHADSTYLLKLQCVIRTKNNLYIITQFCEGKDLAKILRKKRKMNEVEAQSIMKQLLSGYKELYNLKIIHRDLKLANLFITKGRVKIADFGFAISESQCSEKMDYNVGSPYYMPPEALRENKYSFESDVWGIGVIAYQLVYGRVPWKDKDQKVVYEMMINCPIQKLFDDDVVLSDSYKKFISACLCVDKKKRANPEFIINYDWPLAREYVEGIQQHERGQSIGHPLNKTQFFIKQSRNQSLQKVNPFQQQQNRNNSGEKNMNRNRSTSVDRRIPLKGPTNLGGAPKSQRYLGQGKYSEYAMVGQLHYCRFMYQVFRMLRRCSDVDYKGSVQEQLKSRIMDKICMLSKICKNKQNILRSPGFTTYTQSPNFIELSKTIQKYLQKYEKAFPQYKPLWSDNNQNLIKLILQLRNKHLNEIYTLEQVVYYLQIKDLQSKENHHNFYQKSRINYLVDDAYFSEERKHEQGKMEEVRQRLMKKLTYLAIA